MVAGGEEPAVTATTSPLWPHTYKLWAAGDHLHHHGAHHDMEDEDSQQDMAVDLATHASHSSTPRHTSPSDDFHHGHADGALRLPLGGLLPAGPLSSPRDAQDFQDAVRQSLAVVAGSLEGIERHLSRAQGAEPFLEHAQDPEELFARSLAATLRRLPRARRSQAKMKLIAVLAEFEEGS
ncbi:hypothetical protein FOCC_FOCC003364 [Frankliniella occidentalis]|nr:hypothetical protein FOCC_FOCC003364 [Frankliniella occidentalis]